MKKAILTVFLALLAVPYSFAQDQSGKDGQESKSKAVEILNSNGSFLLKEFFDLGKIKGVENEVCIVTNVVTGHKIGLLRLETSYKSLSSSSAETFTGVLDFDELDDCIMCFEYIKNTLLPSTPEVYTEARYKTADGVELGAYSDIDKGGKEWKVYVKTKSYTYRSIAFLSSDNIDALIAVFKQAKSLIEEKTKQ